MNDFDFEVGFRREVGFGKDRRREKGRRSREKSIGLALSVLFTLLEERKGGGVEAKTRVTEQGNRRQASRQPGGSLL